MRRLVVLMTALVAATSIVVASAGAAGAAPSSTPYTCAGGDIPSGTYASITVTGFCDVVPDAVINVVGNLNVAAGAFFDAQSAPSTITVGHNVTAAAGSIFGLGCQPFGYVAHAPHTCAIEPEGHSVITVNGNVTATDANTVLLNGITVDGNVTLTGGGGDIPWALKNNTVGGNFTVIESCAITATDPEDDGNAAVSVVVNTVGRNLNCEGLGPRLTGGAFPGEFNIVGHKTTGQCVGLLSG